MKFLKSLNSLNIEGSDAYIFIDSLVSNSINENEYKFSYLLGPDGKVNFWFIFTRQNDLLKIYQSESNLIELKKVLEKYKIRIKCELNIVYWEIMILIIATNYFKFYNSIHRYICYYFPSQGTGKENLCWQGYK